MAQHYLLWCAGPDKPGIVSGVSKILFKNQCNLEESAMTRLGGEFGALLTFSSKKKVPSSKLEILFLPLIKKLGLSLGIKAISKKGAQFKPQKKSVIVTAHGKDQPGIVYFLTEALAKKKVNITDLNTHRSKGPKAGFIIIVEGELPPKLTLASLKKSLVSVQKKHRLTVQAQALEASVA